MTRSREDSFTPQIDRRAFLQGAAASLAVWGVGLAAPPSRMGIAYTSFGLGGLGGPGGPANFGPRDAYQFLERCSALGAGGIQTPLNGDLGRLRARAEQLGMYLEAAASIPRNGEMLVLEKSLTDAKAAGAIAVRVAMLSGRRYESFATLADWKQWVEQSHRALKLALPIIEKHRVQVALENHKDWTLEELQRLLQTYSSEYLGVCLDFGNNLALLDDPLETAETLAPYVRSTHVKDMDVRPDPDGFLLSEVPLGTGLLDLPKIVAILQKANPKVRFSLEMITRDPLKVPCLTGAYWTVFPDRNGRYLARTLKLVNERAGRNP
ncbi:MAG TPA: sugar phosphate isomerase/epimerase family protein, partial [Blastocatellia bacterium]|nr:sugar phosphate isomerase/epimerase family protein [Blastocatellia bacterium]